MEPNTQLKLKSQKINLIRTYLLPRYIHNLVASPSPLDTLNQIDDQIEIKRLIKEILHLHLSATNRIIYTDKSYGNLDVQRVTNIVKLAKLRNNIQLIKSEDIATKKAFSE